MVNNGKVFMPYVGTTNHQPMKTTTPNLAEQSGTYTLGKDLTIHRLGYGAMRITGDGIWGPPKDRDEAIRVLQATQDLGINFIDTADSYGPNVSEELIAKALHPYPDGLLVATKGGLERTGPNEWPVNGRPEHLEEALKGSLKRLKLERIDLYQLHRFDEKVPADEFLGKLAELQSRGTSVTSAYQKLPSTRSSRRKSISKS